MARLLASLGEYIYSVQDGTLYVDLYIGGVFETSAGGVPVVIEQHSDYASEGKVSFTVTPERSAVFTLALRKPDWCDSVEIAVPGQSPQAGEADNDGYIRLTREWQPGDTVQLCFSMPVKRMKSHPLVRQTFAKVALQRGPFVYCLEEADNGKQLYQLRLPQDSPFTLPAPDGLPEGYPGGIRLITAAGRRLGSADGWERELYRSDAAMRSEAAQLRFIPYFSWANRGLGEMRVWVDED
ncbi:Non-reducing end beta-L-arabinofuranosidase [compost metagenome]